MITSPVLEIQGLRVTYGEGPAEIVAVDDLNLNVASGEIVGIIGESGSGKTTLVRTILDLLDRRATIASGLIRFDNTVVYSNKVNKLATLRGARIGMVFQDTTGSLNPVMKVGKQLLEVVRAHRDISRRDAKLHILDTLRLLDFADPQHVANSYPFELSGGMCQRVAIAAAAVAEPDLIIADESTSALDVTTQAQVCEVLRSATQKGRWTLMFVTHDILLASELCTRLVVMYGGQIVEDGDVQTVIERPRHPYTRALINAVPLWEAASRLQGIPGLPPRVSAGTIGCRFAPRCTSRQEQCVERNIGWSKDVALAADGRAHGYRCMFPVAYESNSAATAAN